MRSKIQPTFLAVPINAKFLTASTVWLPAFLCQIVMRLV